MMRRLIDIGQLQPCDTAVCFTGPRPKDIYPKHAYSELRRDDYQAIVNRIKDEVRMLCKKGCRQFITGGAQGFDQMAFWAVHGIKKQIPDVTNILMLPFEGQEKIWSPVGLFSQEEYHLMRKLADKVLICSKVNLSASDAAAALLYRNEVMVAVAGTVIGMAKDDSWQEPGKRGGTAHCLRHAREKGRNLIIKSFL